MHTSKHNGANDKYKYFFYKQQVHAHRAFRESAVVHFPFNIPFYNMKKITTCMYNYYYIFKAL